MVIGPDMKEYHQILDNQEISWLVQAFLRSPDRLEKGASEEEIIKVITWAEELKLDVIIKFGILHEIYRGALVLGINKDNEVVMSLSKELPDDRENTEELLISSILEAL